MGTLCGPDFPPRLTLGVSGGGDSMAMLFLAAPWAHRMGIAVQVVTVDHGLRPESAAEAELVAKVCAELHIPHRTARWTWDGTGNLQAAARNARLRLLGEAGHPIVLAHTQDDQAETVAMALARSAGVDGLAGMRGRSEMGDKLVLRPLLGASRAALRHHCKTLHIDFIDDPSNTDARFERVRVRTTLAGAGIEATALARVADQAREAQLALQARAAEVAHRIVREAHYDIQFDRAGFEATERETQRRLLLGAFRWLAAATKRPRGEELSRALDCALGGGKATLGGCVLVPYDALLYVIREPSRTSSTDSAHGWDGRFSYKKRGLTVKAIGEATSRLTQATPLLPRETLQATPGLFDGETLVACPRVSLGPDIGETLILPQPFASTLIPR